MKAWTADQDLQAKIDGFVETMPLLKHNPIMQCNHAIGSRIMNSGIASHAFDAGLLDPKDDIDLIDELECG
jgi:hypothetical protein